MKDFLSDIKNNYKYGRNKFEIYFIFLLFIIILIIFYIFLLNHKTTLHIEKQVNYNAPVPATFSSVERPEYLIQWCPSIEIVDSVNEEEIHGRNGRYKMIIRNGKNNPLHQIEKKIFTDEWDDETLTIDWQFKPLQDTMTDINVTMEGKLPFWVHHWKAAAKADKRMDEALEGLAEYLEMRRNQVEFTVRDSLVVFGDTYYIYREFPYDGYFYQYFHDHFVGILLYAVSEKVYRPAVKPFLVMYREPSEEHLQFERFRIGIPVREIPGSLPPEYGADSLEAGKHFAISFNQDYDFLLNNIYTAHRLLPDTVPVDPKRPLIVRFTSGHSFSKDPAQWQTDVLYPLANE